MKLLVLLALALVSIGARQEPARTTSGKLDLERGFVYATDNWYQDTFGLVRESATNYGEKLDWTVGHDGPDTITVGIGSRRQSGIRLTLDFHYDGERVADCTATGRWRYDFGSKPGDFRGELTDVSGFVRIYSQDGERRKLACLFVIHGVVARDHKEGDPPNLVMGGFEIDDPFGPQPERK